MQVTYGNWIFKTKESVTITLTSTDANASQCIRDWHVFASVTLTTVDGSYITGENFSANFEDYSLINPVAILTSLQKALDARMLQLVNDGLMFWFVTTFTQLTQGSSEGK